MVKIFVGNLATDTTQEGLEELFAKYGTVTECAKYKNYAFVHMDDRKSATKAIRELHQHWVDGRAINVEPSRGRNQGPVKLHIANVEKGFDGELRELFEEYGTVTECAVVKNFAFVHMPHHDEAMDAMEGLDNKEFQGKRIHVQVSKSRPRGAPEEGMEDYPPPHGGGDYYPHPHPYPHPHAHAHPHHPPPPPYYPGPRPEPPYRGRMSAYPPNPPPPPPMPAPPVRRPVYPERDYSDRAAYAVDYYEKYRARPYSAPSYDDRRAIPPPPPPSSALLRERLAASAHDPYERRPPPAPPAYAVRDRSPIRRIPPPPPPALAAGNGYSYERSRLSPMSRAPVYAPPRARDPYAARAPPPPPPPRYAGY